MIAHEQKVIDDLADDLYRGFVKLREAMDNEFEEQGGALALEFSTFSIMEDLYRSDKLAYIVYFSIFTPSRIDPTSPVIVVAKRLLDHLHEEGLTDLTMERLEAKISEMTGMVIVHEFTGGTMAVPVLSLISHVRVGDQSLYLLGAHSTLMATPIGFAVVAANKAANGEL